MRKQHKPNGVYRTIVKTTCYGKRVNYETGAYEDFVIELLGDYSAQAATAACQRLESDRSISVNRVEHERKRYALSYNEFIKYARPIEEN